MVEGVFVMLRISLLLIGLVAALALPVQAREFVAHPVKVSYAPADDVRLSSMASMVFDQNTGQVLFAKNAEVETPIASITKLMTAMVFLDQHPDMNERIKVSEADVDRLKHSSSHLPVGTVLTRKQMLNMALVASENRAASALGRTTLEGGTAAFVAAMNRKARAIGMTRTHFVDPTGLNPENVSTAADLAKMVNYAYAHYGEIRQVASQGYYDMGTRRVMLKKRHQRRHVAYFAVQYRNTNVLTREHSWDIGLSKTGFINEAGHCVVMQTRIAARNVVMVLLDAPNNWDRMRDADHLRDWVESYFGKRT